MSEDLHALPQLIEIYYLPLASVIEVGIVQLLFGFKGIIASISARTLIFFFSADFLEGKHCDDHHFLHVFLHVTAYMQL